MSVPQDKKSYFSYEANNKFLGLEVLRFISTLSVLIWHYQHFYFIGDQRVGFVSSQQPFYSTLSFFYENGFYAVQVFWCLSGFIFFFNYLEKIKDGKLSGGNFIIIRLSRLYPLHFLTLLAVIVMQNVFYQKNQVFFVYQVNDFRHFLLQTWIHIRSATRFSD